MAVLRVELGRPIMVGMLRLRKVGLGKVALLAVLAIAGMTVLTLGARPAQAKSSGVSRSNGIARLDETRQSIDRTLRLIKNGQPERAFAEARDGYLTHFEQVEIPLRVADNKLTIEAEGRFAEIRQAIRSKQSTGKIRDQIVALRAIMDRAERKLTDTGVGAPSLVIGQSFLILFREGFEVVLLLSVLLGYLESAKSAHFMRPILGGVALAAGATVLTVLLMPILFGALPLGREITEAIMSLLAVAVLFYVSFWLIARLEHKRWLEFVKARMWNAVSVGSTASLVAVGFTAVYREGFETSLFYQSILSFGSGLAGYVLIGVGLALVALGVVAYLMFRLGRKLPIKAFMNTAVAMVMLTSVAFLGNAMHTLQSADVLAYHTVPSAPRLPIFLAEATGFWPTRETLLGQLGLSLVYVMGGLYVFVIKPRLDRRAARPVPSSAAHA